MERRDIYAIAYKILDLVMEKPMNKGELRRWPSSTFEQLLGNMVDNNLIFEKASDVYTGLRTLTYQAAPKGITYHDTFNKLPHAIQTRPSAYARILASAKDNPVGVATLSEKAVYSAIARRLENLSRAGLIDGYREYKRTGAPHEIKTTEKGVKALKTFENLKEMLDL